MNARQFGVAMAAVALGLATVPPVHGTTRVRAEQEVTIGTCIKRAAGGRAWLEKTLWGLRDQEAGWIGAELRNDNGTHDLGPLQVNSWWAPRIAAMTGRPAAQVRHWLAHDACFNVDAARWIFLSALGGTGDYWKAIGIYHSPTSWRQRRYTASVVAKLKRRFGADIFSPSAHAQADIGRASQSVGGGNI